MSGKDNSLSSSITTNRSHASYKSYSSPVTKEKTSAQRPFVCTVSFPLVLFLMGMFEEIQEFQTKPTGTAVVIPFCSSLLTGDVPVEAFPSNKGRKNKDA